MDTLSPAQLIADIYTHFRTAKEWPLVRTLQSRYGSSTNVRVVAAEAGARRILCEAAVDGRCSLPLSEIADIAASADDMDRLFDALRIVAAHTAEHGASPISSAAFAPLVNADAAALRRLGHMLSLVDRLWSSYSPPNVAGEFQFTPTETAIFFDKVSNYREYLEARDRIEADQRRINDSRALEYRQSNAAWLEGAPPPPDPVSVTEPPESKMPPEVATPFGVYRLGPLLGQGGSGRVFRARHPSGQHVAIKVISPEAVEAGKAHRAQNEIMFGVRNGHPNVITIIDYGVVQAGREALPFFVMPYYPLTLRAIMSAKIPPDKVLRVFGDVLNGVEAAHLLNVWHRDIKPENVLSNADTTQLVVADFGIAHFTADLLVNAVETDHRERLANFAYSAPEQKQRGLPVDHRADIFALGLILNEMFTGHIPLGTGYPTIGAIAPAYAYLDGIVESMIRSRVQDRIATIREVKEELIARENHFISQQKLMALSKKVVPESTIDDDLVVDPIHLTGADYQGGRLIFLLSKAPKDMWLRHFSQISGVAYFPGQGPSAISFDGPRASVPAMENQVNILVEHFKEYLEKTTQDYHGWLLARQAEEQRHQKEKIASRLREEEIRERVLRNIKI